MVFSIEIVFLCMSSSCMRAGQYQRSRLRVSQPKSIYASPGSAAVSEKGAMCDRYPPGGTSIFLLR